MIAWLILFAIAYTACTYVIAGTAIRQLLRARRPMAGRVRLVVALALAIAAAAVWPLMTVALVLSRPFDRRESR